MKRNLTIFPLALLCAMAVSCGPKGNIALLRSTTASSSFDNNLTAQLLTDGLACCGTPCFLEVITSEGEVDKVERECTLDSDRMSRNIINGTQGWIEYRFHGYSVDAVSAEVLFQEALKGGRGGENHIVTIPVERVEETGGLRINLSFPHHARWRVKDVQFFKEDGTLIEDALPSNHFSSAWMSAGNNTEWAQVDLGSDKLVRGVKMHWITPAQKAWVETSHDCKKWRKRGELDADGCAKLFAFCRYLRICMESSSRVCASELEVFGTVKAAAQMPEWQLQRAPQVAQSGEELSTETADCQGWIPATVPGTALSSYIDLGAVPDPDWGDNWAQISESYFNCDWWYRHEFQQKKSEDKTYFLCLDGINWKAEVYLNGNKLTDIAGAFIRSKTEITDLLKDGRNVLAVKIIHNAHTGAVKTKTARWTGYNGGIMGADSPTFLASIGWDWMTTVRGRNCGIWNNVRIEETLGAQISDPLVSTKIEKNRKASVSVSVQVNCYSPVEVEGWIDNIHFRKKTAESGLVTFSPEEFPQLKATSLDLWWPNGLGYPVLHKAGFVVRSEDGRICDSLKFNTGIREITSTIEDDCLKLFVNGRRVNPMGGNWGFCQQNLRYSKKDYQAAIDYHRQMNFNMIRNWVGQIPHEEFYDACDECGILVWQDFWLANPGDGPDPDDEAMFLANADDYVRRIRRHPCIALYCGRNEGFPPESLDNALRDDVVSVLHPDIPYISSSADGPVSGHGPYNARQSRENFDSLSKLHSERGMPCVPVFESLSQMMAPEDVWPQGEMWGKHDFTQVGAQMCTTYNKMLEDTFGEFSSARQFAGYAQWLNYEGYRSIFEGANSAGRQGMLLWMSHSCWPSLVFCTYDYYMRPGGAFFGSKKGCEPLHIQYNPVTGRVEIVNNNVGGAYALWAVTKIYSWRGENLGETYTPVNSDSDSTTSIGFEAPSTDQPYYISLALTTQNGETISDNFYMIPGHREIGLKPLRTLREAQLQTSAEVDEDEVLHFSVKNVDDVPALMLRLILSDGAGNEEILPNYYSDNYFSLMPGEKKSVDIMWPSDVKVGKPSVRVVQLASYNE